MPLQEAGGTTVRVAVEQGQVGLVRTRMDEILARFSNDLFTEYTASIVREVPGATDQLPSMALSVQGGGKLANAPDGQGIFSFQS